MKYCVVTFGCRVNQADSLGFEEQLLAAGATPAPAERADLVVVNTCSVTATADQGARQTIRRIARHNPMARIVVTGCYATRRADEVRNLPNVVSVVPNDDKPQFLQFIRSVAATSSVASGMSGLTTAERFSDGEGSCGASIEPGFAGRTAFTLRVQTGCAEACAYCIIPATRGAPRSVALAAVLAEVERVSAAGFKEIVLTGVHLGSYGRDLAPPASLLDLLTALVTLRLANDVRFRISSLEPMDCAPGIVRLVAEDGRFAPHFHLPLQHASNRVLNAMRRPYSIEYFRALVDRIRSLLPTASIGTDIVVGFPGESAEDFEELAAYLEASPLTHVHVFPYSDRPGTVASGMTTKIAAPVIRERGRRIREISGRLTARFAAAQLGTVHRALTLENGSLAVTGNFLKVQIPHIHPRNEWVTVRVTEAGSTMRGVLVT